MSAKLARHTCSVLRRKFQSPLETLGDYYKPGDIVGYAGLESSYETMLRGEKGYKYLAVNARGQVVGSYDEGKIDVAAQDGSDCISLDRRGSSSHGGVAAYGTARRRGCLLTRTTGRCSR